MSVEQFVKQRISDTRNAISIGDQRKAIEAILKVPCYIDCFTCCHFDNGHCEKEDNIVPLEVRPFGCGKGEQEVPF